MSNFPRGYARATAAEVREWAAENDLPAGGERGRLPGATVEAFNAAHGKGKGRKRYEKNLPVGTITLQEFGPKGGLKREVTTTAEQVRAFAALNGIPVSSRGRLSAEAREAYLASV